MSSISGILLVVILLAVCRPFLLHSCSLVGRTFELRQHHICVQKDDMNQIYSDDIREKSICINGDIGEILSALEPRTQN